MIRKVFVNGKPYLLDDDGTMLPPVMGGQWGDYKDPGYGAGTAPTPRPAAGGPQKWDIRWVTNNVGLLEMQEWDGTRWVATGDVRNPIDTGGTGSTGSYHPPEWRPGELELGQEAQAIDREQIAADRQNLLDQLQIEFDQELHLSDINHQNALEILNRNLEHAEGLQKEMIQANIDLENLRHKNDVVELKMKLEADQKNIIYSEIGATKRTLIEQKGAMERELLGLGPDPFKQAAGLSGQVTRGITPQTQAVGQAKAFINQPLPQATMDMPLPQLQAILAGTEGIQPPMASGFGMSAPIGMAKGGAVKTKRGKKQSVIVGEAGLPEIVTGSDFEVTPLAGMAQGGMAVGSWQGGSPWGASPGMIKKPYSAPSTPPGWAPKPIPGVATTPYQAPRPSTKPIPGVAGTTWGAPRPGKPPPPPPWWMPAPYGDPATVAGILQQVNPLYAGSGFGTVPVADRGPGVGIGLPPGLSALSSPMDVLGQLGVSPKLIRTAPQPGEVGLDPLHPEALGHTYFIDDQGQRHYIPGGNDPGVLAELGFDPSQVVLVAPSDVLQFPPAPAGTPIPEAGAVTGLAPEFGALGTPLIEPTSGAILPALHKIAGLYARGGAAAQENIRDLYGQFYEPHIIKSILTGATPTGMGTGRRIGGIGMGY